MLDRNARDIEAERLEADKADILLIVSATPICRLKAELSLLIDVARLMISYHFMLAHEFKLSHLAVTYLRPSLHCKAI